MGNRLDAYRGCLLGLAAGDALGYTVANQSLEQIRQNYGPNGLLGYDLVNGYAYVTSYTQLAAYACNGLLMGVTRGQMRGVMAPYVRYVALAEQEWARYQAYRRDPHYLNHCWISREQELRFRRCMDNLMLDTATRGAFGTMEGNRNRYQTPGSITAAIPVGLFFNPDRMDRSEVVRLGAEVVALTHGNPLAFLAGAALAYIISRITWDGDRDLRRVAKDAMTRAYAPYSGFYVGAALLCAVVVRTFMPRVILPELDISNMVLISLAALVLD